jgi:hypothetical protein
MLNIVKHFPFKMYPKVNYCKYIVFILIDIQHFLAIFYVPS